MIKNVFAGATMLRCIRGAIEQVYIQKRHTYGAGSLKKKKKKRKKSALKVVLGS